MTVGSHFTARISVSSVRVCRHGSIFIRVRIPELLLMTEGPRLAAHISLSSVGVSCRYSPSAGVRIPGL